MPGDGKPDGEPDGSAQNPDGKAGGGTGAPDGGGDKSTQFDQSLIQGVSLNDLDPKSRSIVEARLKAIDRNNTRKRMQETQKVRQAEENLVLLDQYTALSKDRRVAAAMEEALRNPRGAVEGRDEPDGDAEDAPPPIVEDPAVNLKNFADWSERRSEKKYNAKLETRIRELEGKLGRSLGPLHDGRLETDWDKAVGEYPDTDFPEVHVAKDEVIAFAREKGIPVKKALWAVMGEELGSKLRQTTEDAREKRSEKSRNLADEPYPRLKRLLEAGERKPFKSSADAEAYFKEHGYPKPRNGVKAGVGAEE